VLSAGGVPLALDNPLNRVRVSLDRPAVASASVTSDGARAAITGVSPGQTSLVIVYQRQLASGAYRDVHQGRHRMQTVQVRVSVVVKP
jgi:hypothetical protein